MFAGFQIASALSKCPNVYNRFKIVSVNNIPNLQPMTFAIVNESLYEQPGSHWTAIFRLPDGNFE